MKHREKKVEEIKHRYPRHKFHRPQGPGGIGHGPQGPGGIDADYHGFGLRYEGLNGERLSERGSSATSARLF